MAEHVRCSRFLQRPSDIRTAAVANVLHNAAALFYVFPALQQQQPMVASPLVGFF